MTLSWIVKTMIKRRFGVLSFQKWCDNIDGSAQRFVKWLFLLEKTWQKDKMLKNLHNGNTLTISYCRHS
jgi:hypothetical protein